MLEMRMEDCLLRGDSSALVSVLHYDRLTSSTLTRLDQLVTKDLCASGFTRVLVVLKSLEMLSENRDDLETLINHGLTAKVMSWFEAVHDLLTSDLQRNSAPLLSLTEEFYDYFLLLGQASLPVSQLSVVLLQLARFALETEIHFSLRLEAIRTFNSILESLSREQRRLIQTDQNQIQILSQMAAAVLTAGDYELQVSLSEALCRLTPKKVREQRANQWFSSCDISSAFCDIKDGDFEVDCRHFLNFVNCYHGDQRRVYTFPCLRAFLDSTELFPPKDDKLDKFWIDFNLTSECVSFFIDEPQGFLWGSVHLLKEEVDRYSLQVKRDERTGAQTVLSVWLNTPIMHHNSRGQTVELNFDSKHHQELEEAVGRVFKRSRSPPLVTLSGGIALVSPPAVRHGSRSYGRKKPQSQLKILPLSSPSSDEDSSVMKVMNLKGQFVHFLLDKLKLTFNELYLRLQTPATNTAEFLFNQIRHSTPTLSSGVPVEAEPQISKVQTEEPEGSSSPLKKEVFSPGRKRAAPDSGYLSDQTDGLSTHKRRAWPQPEGEGSNSTYTEGVRSHEEKVELFGGAESDIEKAGPLTESGVEPETDLTSGITAAFNTFKTQLEQHLRGSWRNAEDEVLLSLKECQQHISSLLTAVHQHRLVLLHRFESSIADQLSRLQEKSSSLNSMNTQILSFFQSEMQRLGSFCAEHLQRLKSWESEESVRDHPSSQ